MFSVYTTPEECESAAVKSPAILDLCSKKTRAGKSRDYRDVIVLKKLCIQSVFRPLENESRRFQIPPE